MTDPVAPNSVVKVGNTVFANDGKFSLLAGPCAMESRGHAFDMAGSLKEITSKLGIDFIYKSSFDKANRTSIAAKRGVGLDAAMEIFSDIRKDLELAVVTDVHEKEQCAVVGEVVDILQIPAF
ncbi:MAG: 3-deoxy-8-phosphooctulonate synthase, partial [Hyphomicrobiales bacterium]